MFNKYPSTPQFRNVVKEVREHCDYHNIPYPTLEFEGTVKLHGTNAAVGYNYHDKVMWCQSRNNIITPEKDNAGFANWVEDNKTAFDLIFQYLDSPEDNEVIIYGEWCGGNIQKGVAITGLPKMFVIFAIKIDDVWADMSCFDCLGFCVDILNEAGIYFIDQFDCFSISIDFNKPEESLNKLTKITQQVEESCPVGEVFNKEGVGEGVVWKGWLVNKHLMFKVKGEKHSVTKVKKLVQVDPEIVESINKFVDYAVTENRLQQGLDEVGLSQDKIGAFIGWVNKDVYKEEQDVLECNNLTMKQVAKNMSNKARTWYLDKLNKEF